MKKELREIRRDQELGLEACRFQGLEQTFPNHFHDYYVVGLVEAGNRRLFCKNRDYIIGPGTLLVFQPGDSHGCAPSGGGGLDYRALHIPRETMGELAEELTGEAEPPEFPENVIRDQETADCFLRLHRMVMAGSREFEREETLLLLASLLFARYGRPAGGEMPAAGEAVKRACAYMETHYSRRITLDELCRESGLSRSALLRAFTGSRGVTPYRCLQALRISRARELLEQGVPPVEAGLRTGFSDQSHFSNFFTQFIGLPPGLYGRMYKEERE